MNRPRKLTLVARIESDRYVLFDERQNGHGMSTNHLRPGGKLERQAASH
jgi:hypothetical protein